jgi:hypothetical protein
MSSVSRGVTEHTLNIKPSSGPVNQDMRHFNLEKHRAIGEEQSRLVATGFFKEDHHPN